MVYFGMVKDGEETVLYEHNVMHDLKLTVDAKYDGERYLRSYAAGCRATSLFYDQQRRSQLAQDRRIQRLCVPARRASTPTIIFGRGVLRRKARLCNNDSKRRPPKIITALAKTMYTDLNIADHGASVQPDVPEIDKKESWEQTLAALGNRREFRHTWSVLGPAGEKIPYHDPSEWLAIDNWSHD